MAKFSGISCGIKKDRKDLGAILLEDGTYVFGFFTSNRIKSEAIERAEKLIRKGSKKIKAIYVISGNALCRYVGVEKDIEKMVKKFSQDLSEFSGRRVKPDEILLLSTGKIGVKIDTDAVLKNSKLVIDNLSDDFSDFSQAILTTDTKPKVVKFESGDFYVIGIAKGAGMIFPNFATTLSFIITNAKIPKRFEKVCYQILQNTIGAINIDSSQSTNDSCIFSFENKISVKSDIIKKGLEFVLSNLAVKIAEDGEGVKHVVKLDVFNAQSVSSAKRICEKISYSFLLRASIAGQSPDFGRILSAIGSAGEKIKNVSIWITDEFKFFDFVKEGTKKIQVVRNSKIIGENLEKAEDIMKDEKYTFLIDLGIKSKHRYSMLITDITQEYIGINMTM